MSTNTPERFREVEPLRDVHGIVAQVCNERYAVEAALAEIFGEDDDE